MRFKDTQNHLLGISACQRAPLFFFLSLKASKKSASTSAKGECPEKKTASIENPPVVYKSKLAKAKEERAAARKKRLAENALKPKKIVYKALKFSFYTYDLEPGTDGNPHRFNLARQIKQY